MCTSVILGVDQEKRQTMFNSEIEVITKVSMIFGAMPGNKMNKFLKENLNAGDLRKETTWVELNSKVAYHDQTIYLCENLDAKQFHLEGATRLVESDNYLLDGIEYDHFTKLPVSL